MSLIPFIPRPIGSGDIAMSLASAAVCPSICLSINIFIPLYTSYRSEYFDDTSQLCRTGHDVVSRTKMKALALILFELSSL